MTRGQQRDLFPGALEMMVLQTLKRQPMHGYALAQRIKEVRGHQVKLFETASG